MKTVLTLLAPLLMTASLSVDAADRLVPPDAARKPHVVKAPHGAQRVDEYYWLRDDERKNPQMLAYLTARIEFPEDEIPAQDIAPPLQEALRALHRFDRHGRCRHTIAALRGRYTTVIVTHNLAQARRIADDVAMFWSDEGVGTLVEHGPAARVFEAPGSEITAAYVRGSRG